MSTAAPLANGPTPHTSRSTPALPTARPATLASRTALELRKMLDTRSAQVLVATILGLVLLACGIMVAFHFDDTFVDVLQIAVLPLVYLLPVLGLLTMAGEWRHGTALWTYALDPRRTFVFVAKLAAVAVVVVVATAVLLMSATATAALLGIGIPTGMEYVRAAVFALLGIGAVTLLGTALGASLLIAPLAIVLLLLAPQLVPQLLMLSQTGSRLVPWVDIQSVYMGGFVGQFPALEHTLTAVGLWVVLPLVIGLVRNARKDA